jgi:thiazole tautomerase (transcriptional regulator TenI)
LRPFEPDLVKTNVGKWCVFSKSSKVDPKTTSFLNKRRWFFIVEMSKELHIVSTGRQSDQHLIEIIKDIHPYITALHIREKSKSAKELVSLIMKLVLAGVPLSKLIVNDRVDVAVSCRAKGVQLGFNSLDVSFVRPNFPSLNVGCSIHSMEEAKYAEQHGADFVMYGHIFQTKSKQGKRPKGLDLLKEAAASTSLPVIAIGGIETSHVRDVLAAGASGIAVMSGVLEADSPLQATIEYRNQLEVSRCNMMH